jgi:hypothetical protein
MLMPAAETSMPMPSYEHISQTTVPYFLKNLHQQILSQGNGIRKEIKEADRPD